MKIFNKSILAGLSLAVLGGALVLLDSGSQYTPRTKSEASTHGIEGALDFMHALKKNQITGKVDLGDVLAAREAINNQKLYKKGGLPLNWNPIGPDNYGGRTRAILVDRRNPNVLWAGGVSGGLWKSTNKGASWQAINDFQENLSVVSICQTSDGTIYYGTGESSLNGLWQSDGEEYSSFNGDGIFKSTSDSTFVQLTTSRIFNAVSSMAVDPVDNTVYAGTDRGLYYSDDKGTTWKKLRDGNTREVKISSNRTVLAYIGTLLWRSTNGKDANSYVRVDGIPTSNRIAMAFSNQDPNYAYLLISGGVTITTTGGTINASSGMVGVYQSKDNGVTFSQIIGKESQYFNLLTHLSLGSSQGTYDLVIEVHPRDKERIFMGGIYWAEWTPTQGPRIVGNMFDSPFNPFGIHADKHAITFDTVSNPIIMYIGSDGGVARTTNAELTNYSNLYTGFATTQFYGVAAGTNGTVIGGTQDNNTLLMDRKGSTPQRGKDILGGDGFRCEVSVINPAIMFIENQYGGLHRSLNNGGSASEIWDNRISASHVSSRQANNIFNTPMRLWENQSNGTGRLYYGMNNSVWMARGIVETGAEIRWFKVANLSVNPHIIEATKDGKHLFIGSLNGMVVRVDGLNRANFDTTEIVAYAGISDSLSTISVRGNLPSGRAITDIEIDDNNPNRVLVTMGNYGNTSYVYVTENALDAVPTWRSLQGNLPAFPVYDVEIYEKNPDILIAGTEYGIWATTNGQSATPVWTDQTNNKFPHVAVYELRQVSEKAWTGPVLYAATHGRGIFESRSLLTSVPQVAKSTALALTVYPNPAADAAHLKFTSVKVGAATVKIFDLKGNVVFNQSVQITKGTNQIDLNTMKLSNGMYIASVEGVVSGKTKFLVAN
jgi:photosystem II stability/assembly factor-like uncharacterized protein